jgi:hypothetical protein
MSEADERALRAIENAWIRIQAEPVRDGVLPDVAFNLITSSASGDSLATFWPAPVPAADLSDSPQI